MSAEYVDQVRIDYVRVPMRDGVELCAKVTRPNAAGSFPAIMEYNPYRRLKKLRADYREEYPPVVSYLAERGYAVVQFDVRGTGNSGGTSTEVYSADERQDGYDMVGWIADQSWCTGNVGMIGKSYSAVVQWQVAVQNPPALKAIIVRSANDNVYNEWVYPGGCLRPYMFDSYSANMNTWNFAPPDPDVVGEQWESLWRERLEGNSPWGIGYLSHPVDDDFWKDRSLSTDFRRVKCAAFIISGWADCYPTALLRAFENLSCPKKAMVGPWGHWYGEEDVTVPGPRTDTRPIYARWFDHWLKGIDNGIMEEPPVTVFVRRYTPPSPCMPLVDRGEWRSENEWPIARREDRSFYLGNSTLDASPSAYVEHELTHDARDGTASGLHWGGGVLPWAMPVDQRHGGGLGLTFTTDALDDDLEVTGTPSVHLFVSSTASLAYFHAKLIDIAPDGTEKLVRFGGLSTSHRESHESPTPITPGEIVELTVPIKTLAYVFEKGHRVRVTISSADFQNAWPTPEPAVHTVYCGESYPSRLQLPVIGATSESLSEPDLVELPPANPEVLNRPIEYSLKHDWANETSTARLHVGTGDENNRLVLLSDFTVSGPNPADATLEASGHYRVRREEYDVEVRSTETTRSDADNFYHSVRVEIDRDGESFFEKSWDITVPRHHN